MKKPFKTFLLTVIGKDRPGIISTVTGVLAASQCNLEDISMTILEGEFSMMLVMSCPTARSFERIQKDCGRLEKNSKLNFFWREIKGKLVRGEKHLKGSQSYLVSAMGKDRTGIVYEISRYLAQKKMNVTDLNSRILGKSPNVIYAMMLEVDVPKHVSVGMISKDLEKIARKLKVEIRLKPVERFEC